MKLFRKLMWTCLFLIAFACCVRQLADFVGSTVSLRTYICSIIWSGSALSYMLIAQSNTDDSSRVAWILDRIMAGLLLLNTGFNVALALWELIPSIHFAVLAITEFIQIWLALSFTVMLPRIFRFANPLRSNA